MNVKAGLERRLGFQAPWVQAVVVIWGDFRQQLHEQRHVIYVTGDGLVQWLASLPQRATAPQRAACLAALTELRREIAPLRA